VKVVAVVCCRHRLLKYADQARRNENLTIPLGFATMTDSGYCGLKPHMRTTCYSKACCRMRHTDSLPLEFLRLPLARGPWLRRLNDWWRGSWRSSRARRLGVGDCRIQSVSISRVIRHANHSQVVHVRPWLLRKLVVSSATSTSA
jgi:hypothetical protein